jgi:hypothetical protein
VFIGRPSCWGNPFKIGVDGDRDEVIRKYKDWILTQPDLLARLPELKDKRLGCYCFPERCHGDVLVELLSCRHEWGKASEFAVDTTCLKCGAYKCDVCGAGVKDPTYGLCRKCYSRLYGKDSENME